MADQDKPEEGSSNARRPRDGQRGAWSSGARAGSGQRGDSGRGGPYRDRDARRDAPARDGERKPYAKRDGDRPYVKRDGGQKPYPKRDGERKSYVKRDGDQTPYARRDGDRPYVKRDADALRTPYRAASGDRSRAGGPGTSRAGGPRPTRGGAGRSDRAPRAGEARPMRAMHDSPVIPDDVTGRDLHPSARNELKTLSKENAEEVARHLAMAARLIDEDPASAHQHALAASRRAGRIAVVRESLAITAYAVGDYALALRELRTYRRISGREDQIALLVDSERGVGRPDRALEAGRAVDRSELPVPVRVQLAIAMSGARLDLAQPDRALQELDIPELDPNRAYEWSPELFAARATVLDELGRTEEAAEWSRRADVAADALFAASGAGDLETIEIESLEEEADDPADADDADADGAAGSDDDDAGA